MDERQYVHLARLESDYRSMTQLPGPVITWEPASPLNPSQGIYPDKYHVTFNILAPTPEGETRGHTIEIDCSSLDYPTRAAPSLKFLTSEVMHPHVYSDGSRRICIGGFPLSESLAQLCIRMARFLQFDSTLINKDSIASAAHNQWYTQNRSRLPIDHSPLPVIDGQASAIRVIRVASANTTPPLNPAPPPTPASPPAAEGTGTAWIRRRGPVTRPE